MSFKPMLASPADLTNLRFPVYASPKLDGIRGSVCKGVLLTRSLKEVPNRHVFTLLSDNYLEGFDGELIVGNPTDPAVYRNTTSAIMRRADCPDFIYYVFDLHDCKKDVDYKRRLYLLENAVEQLPKELRQCVRVLEQTLVSDSNELLEYEQSKIEQGYEGVIVRDPGSPYKFGRSSPKEGYLLKVKRFEDSEALIVGMEELMHNANEAFTSELGRSKRSTAKEGLVPMGTMGNLVCRDLKTGVEFRIGTGFTELVRKAFWNDQARHINKSIVKYKFFPVGVKDLPRHPVWLGFRDERDL